MGRAFKLSALQVVKLNGPGIYGDGAGLCLRVTDGGSKHWIFRFMLQGRARWMGLGSFPDVSLDDARESAADARKKVRAGIDPINARDSDLARDRARAARSMSFQQCVDAYIALHRSSWKNEKHIGQWTNTLTSYCGPVFGNLPVGEVDTALILKVLRPIWAEKSETASRLRGRIEAVLDSATVHGYRVGDNPARWKGHLNKILPHISKVARTVHLAALPYSEIGTFMQSLRKQIGIAARATEFAILTACRSGEVRGATWDEIDLAAKIWIIPATRMKAEREHRVPLSDSALEILKTRKADRDPEHDGNLVFPGQRVGKPLSDMSLTAVLRRMGRNDITVHGFRSTFRDWAAESTAYPREVAEMALAHAISNKVEAAYRRGDLLEKRAKMMGDWAMYCATATATASVTPIRRKGKTAA